MGSSIPCCDKNGKQHPLCQYKMGKYVTSINTHYKNNETKKLARLVFDDNNNNKSIRDDTKAAARQSLNCIKNKKNKIWQKMIFKMADGILTPCNVARSRH